MDCYPGTTCNEFIGIHEVMILGIFYTANKCRVNVRMDKMGNQTSPICSVGAIKLNSKSKEAKPE